MNHGIKYIGPILNGRSNYIEWCSKAKLFLEANGVMPYIDDSDNGPDKQYYFKPNDTPISKELHLRYSEKLKEFKEKSKRALAILKSIISMELGERFKEKSNPKELWDTINKIYGETSLDLIGRYFNKLIESNYNDFSSMDEYTNNILSSYIYLKDLKFELQKAYIIWIVFNGLNDSFDSFKSRKTEEISKDLINNNIDLDKLISELIFEESRMKGSIESNKVIKPQNTIPNCIYCGKKGHLESKCFKKHPELYNRDYKRSKNSKNNNNNKNKLYKVTKELNNLKKSNKSYNKYKNNKKANQNNNKIKKDSKSSNIEEINQASPKDFDIASSPEYENNIMVLLANHTIKSKNNIILDSGATEHYCPNKEWLINYETYKVPKYANIANGESILILGHGDIPIIINNKRIFIRMVKHIPSLKSTLISTKQAAKKGWASNILPPGNVYNFSNKLLNIKAEARWIDNAFYLECDINYELINQLNHNININIINRNTDSKIDSKDESKKESESSKIDSGVESKKELKNINLNDLDLWHKRLNHINKDYIIKTLNLKESNVSLSHCEACIYAKMTQNISKTLSDIKLDQFERVSTDICGQFKIPGLKGEKYFITFTEWATRGIWVYPIKYKSDAFTILKDFYNLILNQFNKSIKIIRLDNAKEFNSNQWNLFAKSKGIILEFISPHHHSQNGIAEKLNRYLVERLLVFIKDKNLPTFLWPNILKGIVYIKNRHYNRTIKSSPFKLILNKEPNLKGIRVLGSLAYVLKHKEKRTNKLDYKSEKGILVGFESSKNLLFYIPNRNKIMSSSDYIIKEDILYYNKDTNNNNNLTINDLLERLNIETLENENQEEEVDIHNNNYNNLQNNNDYNDSNINNNKRLVVEIPYNSNLPTPIRQSKRTRGVEPLLDIYNLAYISYIESKNQNYKIKLNNIGDDQYENKILLCFSVKTEEKVIIKRPYNKNLITPESYSEAINSDQKENWEKAMNYEIKTLEKNNTWDIIKKNNNIKELNVLKTKWVYKIKYLSEDNIEFKARYVAKGFEQLYGLDYLNTFASVIKQMAWKLIFALAINKGWYIYKIDMILAFVQGDIDKNIYIKSPEIYYNENIILKLNKALYGLKQSARIWYTTLKSILNKLNFINIKSDECIFINKYSGLILNIFVDDIAIVGSSEVLIKDFIKNLKRYLDLKDLGPIKDYLGIQINLNKESIELFQEEYIEKCLTDLNLENAPL
ncbi:reverse transcriptase domain protein [Botrytis cinerea]